MVRPSAYQIFVFIFVFCLAAAPVFGSMWTTESSPLPYWEARIGAESIIGFSGAGSTVDLSFYAQERAKEYSSIEQIEGFTLLEALYSLATPEYAHTLLEESDRDFRWSVSGMRSHITTESQALHMLNLVQLASDYHKKPRDPQDMYKGVHYASHLKDVAKFTELHIKDEDAYVQKISKRNAKYTVIDGTVATESQSLILLSYVRAYQLVSQTKNHRYMDESASAYFLELSQTALASILEQPPTTPVGKALAILAMSEYLTIAQSPEEFGVVRESINTLAAGLEQEAVSPAEKIISMGALIQTYRVTGRPIDLDASQRLYWSVENQWNEELQSYNPGFDNSISTKEIGIMMWGLRVVHDHLGQLAGDESFTPQAADRVTSMYQSLVVDSDLYYVSGERYIPQGYSDPIAAQFFSENKSEFFDGSRNPDDGLHPPVALSTVRVNNNSWQAVGDPFTVADSLWLTFGTLQMYEPSALADISPVQKKELDILHAEVVEANRKVSERDDVLGQIRAEKMQIIKLAGTILGITVLLLIALLVAFLVQRRMSKKTLKAMRQQMVTKSSSHDDMSGRIKEVASKVKDYESILTKKDDEILYLKEEIELYRDEIGKLHDKLTEKPKGSAKEGKQIAKLRKELEDFRKKEKKEVDRMRKLLVKYDDGVNANVHKLSDDKVRSRYDKLKQKLARSGITKRVRDTLSDGSRSREKISQHQDFVDVERVAKRSKKRKK